MAKKAQKTSNKSNGKVSVFESTLSGLFESNDMDVDKSMETVKTEAVNKTTATKASSLIKANMQFVNVPHALNDSFSLVITHGKNKWKDNEPYFTCNLVAIKGKSKSKSLNSSQLRAFESELPIVKVIADKLDLLQSSLRVVLKFNTATQ